MIYHLDTDALRCAILEKLARGQTGEAPADLLSVFRRVGERYRDVGRAVRAVEAGAPVRVLVDAVFAARGALEECLSDAALRSVVVAEGRRFGRRIAGVFQRIRDGRLG